MARRVQDWRSSSRKEDTARSSSKTCEFSRVIRQVGVEFTYLQFDPGRSSAVTLDNSVHEEFFSADEGVALFNHLLERLAPAFHSVE